MLEDKYRPQTLNDIQLDDKTMDSIIAWINSWNRGLPSPEKPALLLTGHPGTGKTTAARCICNDADWHSVEYNASDTRNEEELSKIVPERSMFGMTCLIFDEADSFVKGEDTGGARCLVDLIKSRSVPIILTANDFFKVPKEVRGVCESQQIYRPSVNALKSYLFNICRKEKLFPSNEVLNAAAESQDYRMGLSMIENNIVLQKNNIKMKAEDVIRSLVTHIEVEIPNLKQVFYNLDTNASHLYDPLDLYRLYEVLVRADILRRRGQEKHAIALLKTIPMTTLEHFEIIPPVYIEKKKEKKNAT